MLSSCFKGSHVDYGFCVKDTEVERILEFVKSKDLDVSNIHHNFKLNCITVQLSFVTLMGGS